VRRLVITALLGAGALYVGFWWMFGGFRCRFPVTHDAEGHARVLRTAAQAWQTEHELLDCPSIDDLDRLGLIDPGLSRLDTWGGSFRLACTKEEITVSSAGPDRQWQTRDDIVVPRGTR
jgi:hypothetical protein